MAIDGVDRLADQEPRQPEQRTPEHRGDDAIGKIRAGLNGGTGNAVAVEAGDVAADDVGDSIAAGIETLFEPDGDAMDMPVETALRDHRRGKSQFKIEPKGTARPNQVRIQPTANAGPRMRMTVSTPRNRRSCC